MTNHRANYTIHRKNAESFRRTYQKLLFLYIMAGLYFHIPFCKRLCGYCDFMRSVKLKYMPQVVEQMHCELETESGFLTDTALKTIYFGGGTPSLLNPVDIQRFIEHAGRVFDTSSLREITVEVNPDDITVEYARSLAATVVNRVSMGIQSLDDRVLEFMGRRHTAQGAIEAVKRLQDAGIENISVDVIFGVAGFGSESLLQTLQGVTELNVQHISAYHLTIEDNTRFGRLLSKGELRQVSEEQSQREFLAVHNTLCNAGFDHYEVSNFAKEGFVSQHNSSYWTGAEYLGIGPGAHSFAKSTRRWCSQSVEQYVEGIEYGSECLSSKDALNEYVMVCLRRKEGIDLELVAERWGKSEAERILKTCEKFVEVGWIEQRDKMIAIPAEQFLISDAVISELFV